MKDFLDVNWPTGNNYTAFIDNKTKVYYGLLKEPDIQCVPPAEEEEDDGGGEGGDKPKKKKAKKDPLFSKKTKSDPNAPTVGRMPLPNLLVSSFSFSPFTFFSVF